jgi:hypothetical protein
VTRALQHTRVTRHVTRHNPTRRLCRRRGIAASACRRAYAPTLHRRMKCVRRVHRRTVVAVPTCRGHVKPDGNQPRLGKNANVGDSGVDATATATAAYLARHRLVTQQPRHQWRFKIRDTGSRATARRARTPVQCVRRTRGSRMTRSRGSQTSSTPLQQRSPQPQPHDPHGPAHRHARRVGGTRDRPPLRGTKKSGVSADRRADSTHTATQRRATTTPRQRHALDGGTK